VSRHADIADAVVTAINDAALGSFTAVRKARPETEREAIETTAAVQVIPAALAVESADRGRVRAHYGVDVGIQKAVDPDDLAAFDVLWDLLPAIRALFELKRISGEGWSATWERTETVGGAEAGYAPEHLTSQRVFTGVLRFTFMVIE